MTRLLAVVAVSCGFVGCLEPPPPLTTATLAEHPTVVQGLLAQWSFREAPEGERWPADFGECNHCAAEPLGFGDPFRTWVKGSGPATSPTAHGGTFLQLDGEDDALRIADDGALLYQRSETTIELRVRINVWWPNEVGFNQSAGLLTSADWREPDQRTLTLELNYEGRLELNLWPPDPTQLCPHSTRPSPRVPNCITTVRSPVVPTGRWVVLAARWVGGDHAALFIDGEAVATEPSYVDVIPPSGRPWLVGAGRYGVIRVDAFDGDLDVLRIYDRALSDEELRLSAQALHAHLPEADPRPAACAPPGGGCAQGTSNGHEAWPGVTACAHPPGAQATCAGGHAPCTSADVFRLTPNQPLWQLGDVFETADGWLFGNQAGIGLPPCGRRQCLPGDVTPRGLLCCAGACL